MKKMFKCLLIILIPLMMVISCSKDDSESDFDKLLSYLNSNGMTIGDLLTNWIVSADSLHNAMGMYDILDLRGADMNENDIVDFEEGHIDGAILTSFEELLEDAAAAEKPIIVVCYTGQSAGHAVMALRLSGYEDARVLKWGMSGWNSAFDKWTANTATLGHANWKASPGEIKLSEEYDEPDLSADGDTGAEMLAARVDAMLAGGFKGIACTDVLDHPEDYFINNFWGASDVEDYGNIKGAYRISPLVLKNLDPDEMVVTYCWTGQTSSMITAYLTVLGYDSLSLKFGVNSMIYDDLEGHKWSGSADFDYVTGP